MNEDNFGPGMRKVLEQIQKLLNLAANNPSEAEATLAAAKAQELLTKYNLDAAMVESVNGIDSKREEIKLKGGFYRFQRDLWKAVAELNYCHYWTQEYSEQKEKKYKDEFTGETKTKIVFRKAWRHEMIGRVVNTRATIAMAKYLELAIERITREEFKGPTTQLYSAWPVSFREGAIARVVDKIQERRGKMIAEEEAKARQAARAGVSTSKAITISSYSKSEDDANNDFVYGEGWSAERAAERAEEAAERKREEEEYTKWAAANPEEAAAKEKAEREEDRKYWSRYRGGTMSYEERRERTRHHGAFYAGQDAGDKISIDPQVGSGSSTKRISKRG